jgi:hypothetical protein
MVMYFDCTKCALHYSLVHKKIYFAVTFFNTAVLVKHDGVDCYRIIHAAYAKTGKIAFEIEQKFRGESDNA